MAAPVGLLAAEIAASGQGWCLMDAAKGRPVRLAETGWQIRRLRRRREWVFAPGSGDFYCWGLPQERLYP